MKQILTALLSAFLALWIASAHASGGEVTLRTAVIVEGNYIKLGDLFDNAGEFADKHIAYAPQPGRRATFDAKWLYRVAHAYKLEWRPFSLNTRATVERASQIVQRDEIREALTDALRERGVGSNVEIELAANNLNFHVAVDKQSSVGIETMNFDPGTGRFIATVAVPADDPAALRTRITGKIHKLVSVPVLSENKRRGEVIHAQDIQWREVRSNEIRDYVVVDEDALIGMAAKRQIASESLIHVSQLRRPVLVPKGSLVTIELSEGAMSLSAQGKALDEGSLGDVIRVANIRSNKIIEVTVNGANRVGVGRSRTHLASN